MANQLIFFEVPFCVEVSFRFPELNFIKMCLRIACLVAEGVEEKVLVGYSTVEKNLHVTKTVSSIFTGLQDLVLN